ncbi:hypothetical protein LWF01_16845 [Saxibacter everestensis]|uniref:Lipoprotein n=1 Tax=Saxibacter everestensis TaxID=2909229 RepID=A0ABY8QU28_9MICO|nr:hypothetical protein LWF01_16845 [Brevibacteriaceae bacterium ZFBP1038]
MNTRSTLMKALPLTLIIAAAGASLTGCDVADSLQERGNGHTKSYEFETGAEGKQAKALPAWVPDDAKQIKQVKRTTGNERIIVLTGDPKALPESCTELAKDDAPKQVDDSLDHATLKADWWEPGTETKATVACDDWSIAIDGDTIRAFVPELNVVEIEDQPTVYK